MVAILQGLNDQNFTVIIVDYLSSIVTGIFQSEIEMQISHFQASDKIKIKLRYKFTKYDVLSLIILVISGMEIKTKIINEDNSCYNLR